MERAEKTEFVPEWNGWEEYFDFWDQFVKSWYECKANDPNALPTDMLTNSIRPLFDAKKEDSRLSKDELPEPYCIDPGTVGVGESFDPAKVGMVVIQMNPGAAQCKNNKKVNLEATKFYSNKDKDEGFLIRDFADKKTCDKKFSKWVERWSCFRETYPSLGCVPPDASVGCGVPPSKVCGHDWWYNGNRRDWFKSFADLELNNVFALETIPYHSKNFDIAKSLFNKEEKSKDYPFFKHLLSRVLLPAGICAQSSGNKFKMVVCCGKKLREFLGELEGVKDVAVSKIFSWDCKYKELTVEDPEIKVLGPSEWQELKTRWPKKDGGYTERWYELYRCEIPYSEGRTRKICRFLVLSIYANSMKFPGVDFRRKDGVEELLKKRIMREVNSNDEKASPDRLNGVSCEQQTLPDSDIKRSEAKSATAGSRQLKRDGACEGQRRQEAFWDSLFAVYPFGSGSVINRRPNQTRTWVSYSLRREGVSLTFVFNQSKARIECNVDGRSDDVYDRLEANRQRIEAAVKHPVNWERKTPRGGDGRSRVSLLLDDCSISNDSDWQKVRVWFCMFMPIFEREICEVLGNGVA